MSHTPGQWGFANAENIYTRGDIGIHVIREGSADGMLVAVVRDNNLRDMQIANARLISAAPDLLEACREVAKEYDDASDWKDAIGKLQRMARAAITRAEGKGGAE